VKLPTDEECEKLRILIDGEGRRLLRKKHLAERPLAAGDSRQHPATSNGGKPVKVRTEAGTPERAPRTLPPLRVRNAADQLRAVFKENPRLLKSKKPPTKNQVYDFMQKCKIKLPPRETWLRYIREAIEKNYLPEFQPGCPGFLPRHPSA